MKPSDTLLQRIKDKVTSTQKDGTRIWSDPLGREPIKSQWGACRWCTGRKIKQTFEYYRAVMNRCESWKRGQVTLEWRSWCAILERTTTDYTTSGAQCWPTELWTPSATAQQVWPWALETASNRQNWVEPIDKESCRSGTSETDLAIVHVFVLSDCQ